LRKARVISYGVQQASHIRQIDIDYFTLNMDIEPNQTLYVNNINEKIPKEVLKKQLYMLFSQYGRVKQITACKGIKLRGQSWIVFHDLNSAMNAMKGKQGFVFYDKPLRITFAKAKSHITERLEGGGQGKGGKSITSSSKKTSKRGRDEMEQESSDNGVAVADSDEHQPKSKDARVESSATVNNTTPNKILFAQNLPVECQKDSSTLVAVFQACSGFVEVRLVPGSKGIAFIEFENEVASGMALRQLSGYQLTPTYSLQLTYSN